jgi:hypothetical protein
MLTAPAAAADITAAAAGMLMGMARAAAVVDQAISLFRLPAPRQYWAAGQEVLQRERTVTSTLLIDDHRYVSF